jgi:hypothetical protein
LSIVEFFKIEFDKPPSSIYKFIKTSLILSGLLIQKLVILEMFLKTII